MSRKMDGPYCSHNYLYHLAVAVSFMATLCLWLSRQSMPERHFLGQAQEPRSVYQRVSHTMPDQENGTNTTEWASEVTWPVIKPNISDPVKPNEIGTDANTVFGNKTANTTDPELRMSSKSPESEMKSASKKMILLWTTWFKDHTWGYGTLGEVPFRDCEYKDCIATSNQSLLDAADLVLFHCYHTDQSFQWPTSRHARQYFGVECQEPPTHAELFKFSFKMNISVSHRLDSDVVFPYFKVEPRKDVLTGPYIPKVPVSQRRKGAVWLVSNCMARSKRNEYAEELSKYINVDIYGFCGTHMCPRYKHSECMDEFERKYTFLLSFENSFCEDYVTEKFSNALGWDVIPIVFGAANYSRIAPPHSYIDTKDFESPRKLAKYLDEISSNETVFGEFFQWKLKYDITVPSLSCEVCKFLHNTDGLHRDAATFDVGRWWNSRGVCDRFVYNTTTNAIENRLG